MLDVGDWLTPARGAVGGVHHHVFGRGCGGWAQGGFKGGRGSDLTRLEAKPPSHLLSTETNIFQSPRCAIQAMEPHPALEVPARQAYPSPEAWMGEGKLCSEMSTGGTGCGGGLFPRRSCSHAHNFRLPTDPWLLCEICTGSWTLSMVPKRDRNQRSREQIAPRHCLLRWQYVSPR